VEQEPNAPEPRKRRPRYRGTHPRRFEEKYKELEPEKHPELIEHVRSRGMTPAGQHVPILVEEVLAVLAPRPGERGVDATLGYGGHARRFLEQLAPGGRLLGLDVDPLELPKTEARLRKLGFDESALTVQRTNFAGLQAALHSVGWSDGADFVFADLGLSSMQIDDPARGFTFKFEGPLDMRMHPARGVSAAQWLARASVQELERALRENADEPQARDLARVLAGRRDPLATTLQLADVVRRALPERYSDDERDLTVRRVFQALRVEVNDEFGVLDALLRQLPASVRSGGRVALLSFHSGEDRRVKHAFERGFQGGVWTRISDEVVRPSPAERRSNPRSAPAKLRWAVRA
jgi:16S rRNA (cytosine1402-N4)-methyltransferase